MIFSSLNFENMISRQQKAIIRKICQEQEKSLLRIEKKMVNRIYKEMRAEGYELSKIEVVAAIAENLKQWGDVKQEPEKFLRHLDDGNIGLIKHHLVQDFLHHDDARPIWYQLNLFDQVNQYRN